MEKPDDVIVTTESAFHALGLTDADDLLVRADLTRTIAAIIKQRQLTQTEVGHMIGMDQPRVSALLRGKITLFSTDRLLKALSDLGQDVELRIVPAMEGKGRIHVAVA
ncbi:MAG: helix-turn-helix transcriptional regulator [Rhodospirillaceae bacterium]